MSDNATVDLMLYAALLILGVIFGILVLIVFFGGIFVGWMLS